MPRSEIARLARIAREHREKLRELENQYAAWVLEAHPEMAPAARGVALDGWIVALGEQRAKTAMADAALGQARLRRRRG